jgi:hypothetical protein
MGLVEISHHCKQRPAGGHERKQNPGYKNAVKAHFHIPNCNTAIVSGVEREGWHLGG